MILLDTNIVIYNFSPKYTDLATVLAEANTQLACSDMTRLEVMCFPGLSLPQLKELQTFFGNVTVFPISPKIVDTAIAIRRQQKSVKVPDAIIAATTLNNKGILWTSNTKDFVRIPGLQWHDPTLHTQC